MFIVNIGIKIEAKSDVQSVIAQKLMENIIFSKFLIKEKILSLSHNLGKRS